MSDRRASGAAGHVTDDDPRGNNVRLGLVVGVRKDVKC